MLMAFSGVSLVNDKKRERLMKICRVAAIILALGMIAGIFVQPYLT